VLIKYNSAKSYPVLPNKIKTCRRAGETNLLTFYKQQNTNNYGFVKGEKYIGIHEGLKLLECNEMELPLPIPNDFYEKQEANMRVFKESFNNINTLTKSEQELIDLLKQQGQVEFADNVRNKKYTGSIKKILEMAMNNEDVSEFFKVEKFENKKEIILNEFLLNSSH
jgi:hypothetical protein